MKLAPLLLAMLLLITACGKKTESTCALTIENITGRYKWSSMTLVKPDGSVVNLQQCQQDDYIELHPNGTYNMWDGTDKCEPTTQRDGTWGVQNGKFIEDGLDYTVDFFDCNKITFHRANTPVSGYSVSFSAIKY